MNPKPKLHITQIGLEDALITVLMFLIIVFALCCGAALACGLCSLESLHFVLGKSVGNAADHLRQNILC